MSKLTSLLNKIDNIENKIKTKKKPAKKILDSIKAGNKNKY